MSTKSKALLRLSYQIGRPPRPAFTGACQRPRPRDHCLRAAPRRARILPRGEGAAMTDVVFTVVYHSARGTTARLAQAVVRGAASAGGVDAAAVHVDDLDAEGAGWWDRLHASDAIVFGSPTYIGAVSARFKLFIERLAGEIWLERMWLDKVAAGFTVSAGRSGDKLNCLQDLMICAMQMGMIWVPVPITGGNYSSTGSEADLNRMAGYLGVMAQANIDEPPDVAPPPSDIATAELHGAHVARVARRLKAGRALHPDLDAPAPGP